ncbi:serine hydrolase [Micromonospora sp. WMMD1102]|uniref:serine hydrolase domain-containing protein n=1 Tax=Micromonospora sp. WMMD1102 TaxID=3016105 RepID=UPI0024154F0F|nr:serine hydrolase domain-containing protein [Micromonospora sp. WMMD1102]MDG4791530.1 serine hydrolase [Micromonospora sp. WMMD1102]
MTTTERLPSRKSRPIRMAAILVTAAAALTATGVGTAAAVLADERPEVTSPARPGNPGRNAVMEDVARSMMAAGPPGFASRIGKDHRVSRTAAGLADIATERPMAPRDQFEAGSNTKTFTAVLALQLVDRGQLKLDAPVARYLPGIVPNGRNITVRMLLNHTSGLYSYTADEEFMAGVVSDPQRVWTDRELLAVAFEHEPNFPPGKDWSYSNTNYTLLGMILEKLTGKSLPVLVQQRIAEPLGLRHTYYANPRAVHTGPGYAHGYGVRLAGPEPVYVDTASWPIGGWGGAAGAVISNTDDLSRFFSAVLQGKLFSKAQLEQMKTTVELPEGFGMKGGYGLGLIRLDSACGTVWGHGGDTLGHHSIALATADGRRTVVSVANAEPIDAEPNARWDHYYKVAMAATDASVCETLDKPVPDSVLADLHSAAPALATTK